MSILSAANAFLRDKKYDEAISCYLRYLNLYSSKDASLFSIFFNLSYAFAKKKEFLTARVYYVQGCIYQGRSLSSFNKPHWWNSVTKSIDIETIAIVVPVYNAVDTIEEALDSLFIQSYENISVIAVNDNSSDKSFYMLKKLQAKYKNFNIIDNPVNNGPFVSVNIALYCFAPENFDFFMKHDADDRVVFDRLTKQVNILTKEKDKLFCTSGYNRIDKTTKEVVGGKKRGHNMTLYKKKVFEELGYYDEVRFGADSEYLERAISRFGADAEVYIPERLTLAYIDSKSNIVSKNPLGSPERVKYQKNFRSLHSKMHILNSWYTYSTFGAYKSLQIIQHKGTEAVVCGVASLKNRINAIVDTIQSMIDQVDLLIIYQNGYKEVSGIFSNPKILVISSLDTNIDMGDAGKYFMLSAFDNCYYFSCDDDLIYPSNYVQVVKDFLKARNNDVIATCHGRVMLKEANSYYKDKKTVYHFADEVNKSQAVHFGGTGVMAFHTSLVDINFNLFRSANMADVWLGLFSRENNVPIMVVPHVKDWILHSDKFDVHTTIFRSGKDKIGKQDLLIKGLVFDDPISHDESNNKNRVKIAIAIPTYNRHEFLKDLLKNLDKEAQGLNVEVIINDDGSSPPVVIQDDFINIKTRLIASQNLGKKQYWITVNKLFDALEKTNADLFFYVADDIKLVKGFFNKAIDVWQSINDEKKLSLNLLNDGREKCWTNYQRTLMPFEKYEVYKSQWLDMIIMFDKKLLKQRVKEIPLSRWANRPNLSSGVGAQLSTINNDAGYNMYQVKDSLVIHGDHDSQMNYDERKLNPLVTK